MLAHTQSHKHALCSSSPAHCTTAASRRARHLCVRANPAPSPTKQADHFGFAQGFAERYELKEPLGSGTFGVVQSARLKATGERFAVKCAVKRKMGNFLHHDFVKRIQHEVDMYNHLGRSLNVVHLHDVYEDDKAVYLVMDMCTGGELWDRIKQGQYREQNAARIISEILRTVAQCHACGVVIRDVKPENFLFQDERPDSPLRMIDFGIAEYCALDQQLKERAGTALYCAPELLRSKYSFKADVWSAGVIAYELLADRLPFQDDDGEMLVGNLRRTRRNLSNKEIFHAILYGPLDFENAPWPQISEGAKDLVQRLLTRDPDARPSALEALHHPWLERAQSGNSSHASSTASTSGKQDSNSDSLNNASLVQRLQQFGTYSRLKQVALSKLASFLAAYENPKLTALKEAFKDESASDKVPYEKVVRVLKSGEFDLSDLEVRQLLSSFELKDGCIDINEWLAALIDWQEMQSLDDWDMLIARVFETFDVEHSGRLGPAELEALLCDHDEGCPTEDTVPAAMRAVEVDNMTSMDSLDVSWRDGSEEGDQARSAGVREDGGSAAGSSGAAQQGSGERSGQQAAALWGDGGLDLPAFAKLLRTAQQDRLDLYESRRNTSSSSSKQQGGT